MSGSEPRDQPIPEWDATQVERDTGTESDEARDAGTRSHAARTERAQWDKGQMATNDEGDDANAPIGRNAMKEGESGLSGNRANPGGGQRWADRDRD